MSTGTNADLVAEYEEFLIGNRALYASAALVIYEHLVLLKYEPDFLWTRKWSAATWIFVFNRYLLLANVLASVVPYSPQICANSWAVNVLAFFTYNTIPTLPIHAFTVLRGFALVQHHVLRLSVMWILVALALGLAGCDAYVEFTASWQYIADPVLGPGCYQTGFLVPSIIIYRVATIGTVFGITSATTVLIITLVMTARQVLRASSLGLKTNLSQILLRDGSLFFLLILLDNILVILGNATVFDGPTITVIADLLNVLPPILLSRFIINLRQADSTTSSSDNPDPSRFSVPMFRMPTMDNMVGDLGEPLDFVEYRLDDDEDGAQDVTPQVDETDSDAAQQDEENVFESTLVGVGSAGLSGSGSGSAATGPSFDWALHSA